RTAPPRSSTLAAPPAPVSPPASAPPPDCSESSRTSSPLPAPRPPPPPRSSPCARPVPRTSDPRDARPTPPALCYPAPWPTPLVCSSAPRSHSERNLRSASCESVIPLCLHEFLCLRLHVADDHRVELPLARVAPEDGHGATGAAAGQEVDYK